MIEIIVGYVIIVAIAGFIGFKIGVKLTLKVGVEEKFIDKTAAKKWANS